MADRMRRRGARGVWQADLRLPDGGRLQTSLRTTDEVQARKRLAELQARVGAGLRPEPGLLTGAYLDRWLAERSGTNPRTRRLYADAVRRMKPLIGRIRLEALTVAQVEAMDARLLASGGEGGRPLAPETVRGVHGVLGTALQEAMRHDLLLRNVAHLAHLPRPSEEEAPHLTPPEVRRLLNSAPDHPWRAFAAVAVYTGCRNAELCALRWSDVDRDLALVRIERQRVVGEDGEMTDDQPKTKRGRRAVPLTPELDEVLRQIEARAKVAADAVGREMPAWVFARWHRAGWGPYRPDTASRSVADLYRAAGLPVPIRPVHTLRRTYATALAEGGAHPRIQAALLGHDPTMSIRYTGHIPAAEREAAEITARRIGGAAGGR